MKPMLYRALLPLVAVAALAVCWNRLPVASAQEDGEEQQLSNEEVILRELNHRLTVNMVETPFGDVVEFLQAALEEKISIVFDSHSLEDERHVREMPVTLKVKNLRVRSVLTMLTERLDCGWTIANEVVLITSADRASEVMMVRTYDVEDLVVKEGESDQTAKFDALIELIQRLVAPDTWRSTGGPGSLGPYAINGLRLVVRQTPQIQYEVGQLLGELRSTPEIPTDEPLNVAKDAPAETPPTPEAKPAEPGK